MIAGPLVAVDIGNTRIKLGWFAGEPPAAAGPALPAPVDSIALGRNEPWDHLDTWWEAQHAPQAPWRIVSVQRATTGRLWDWLGNRGLLNQARLLTPTDLPLQVDLAHPERAGMDRLAAALAANQLRSAGRPAVVIDLGTAITVNLLSPDGHFLGGAILPGLQTAARALHTMTDQLPLLDCSQWSSAPPALGTSTTPAIEAGVFWGAVGAVRELVRQFSRQVPGSPQWFITGGMAGLIAPQFEVDAIHVPHLTLAGIALATPQ